MTRPVVAITIGRNHYDRMFSPAAWHALDAFADVIHHDGPEPADKASLLALLPGADACITSWDVAQLDADVLAAAPRLRAMAHMGSSVKRFVSEALWARGVQVFGNLSVQRALGDAASDFSGYTPKTINWGASLTRERLVVNLNWHYRGRARRDLVAAGPSIEPGTYNWLAPRLVTDVVAEYRLTRKFWVFANLNFVDRI